MQACLCAATGERALSMAHPSCSRPAPRLTHGVRSGSLPSMLSAPACPLSLLAQPEPMGKHLDMTLGPWKHWGVKQPLRPDPQVHALQEVSGGAWGPTQRALKAARLQVGAAWLHIPYPTSHHKGAGGAQSWKCCSETWRCPGEAAHPVAWKVSLGD